MKPYKLLVLFAGRAIAASISPSAGNSPALNGNTILESIPDDTESSNYSSSARSAFKRQIPTEPFLVYRVNRMSPEKVKARGGFPPRQADLSNADFSIYTHSDGTMTGKSPYVSTSIRPQGAELFAPRGQVFYLYEIHATPNFIDTFTTLGGNKMTSKGEPYVWYKTEREFLATGGIKWDQIVSYTRLPDGMNTGKKARKRQPNKDYNKMYDKFRAGGPHYELAGFPEEHEAWTNEPWNQYKAADIKETGLKFVDINGKAVGLNRNTPLQFDIKYTAGKSTFYVPSPNKNSGNPSVPCKRAGVDCIDAQLLPEENVPATPKRIEAVKKAEKVSETEFAELATRHKYNKIPWEWKAKGVKSLSDIRTKILKYSPLKSLPKLRSGSGAAGAIGGALWVGDIVHTFTTNSTALDRAAAITAIIPFVGCAVHTTAAVENKENTAVIAMDSALCLIGDTLILGGLFPIGLLVHLARLIVQLFAPPPEPPTKEEGLQARDKLWTQFLHDRVYRYIYSHNYHNPQQDFAFKLNNTLAVSAIRELSAAAQVIGALNASSETFESDAKLDPARLETASQEAIEKIREALPGKIVRRQRQLLIDIPATFTNGTALSLREVGKAFNEEFVKRFTSQENVEAYPLPKWKQVLQQVAAVSQHGLGLMRRDPYQHARIHLVAVGEYLKTVPVTMPRLFDTAFVVGQSKGLAHIDKKLLSGRDYINLEVKEASGVDLPATVTDRLAIRHAIDVVKVLEGRLKEEELTDVFPGGKKVRQGLQILTAMRCGRLYEDAKIKAAETQRLHNPDILSTKALVDPLIPPIPKHIHELHLSMVLVLIDTVLDTQYDKGANGLLKEEVEKINERFARLREEILGIMTWYTFYPGQSWAYLGIWLDKVI